MANCGRCGHRIEQRLDDSWQHAKLEQGIKEPRTKQICDALYLSKICLEEGCKCQEAYGGSGGIRDSLAKAGKVGERFMAGVSGV